MADLLKILIDAEDRNTIVTARGWGDTLNIRRTGWRASTADTWIDPIGNTLMLHPIQLLPEFRTSADNAPRLRKTDFVANSGAWEEIVDNEKLATDYYLLSDGSNNAEIESTTTYQANQAFWLSNFVYAGKSDPFVFCQFTFGQYHLDIRTDGRTELYEGDTRRAWGYVTPGPMDLNGRMLDLVVIPYKRRQILFWSPSAASGWVYIDDRLTSAKQEDDYSITSGGTVKIKYPASAGRVQFMPLKYKQAGHYLTEVVECAIAPTAEQMESESYYTLEEWDINSGTGAAAFLTEPDGEATFAPDGSKRQYRGRINLNGSGDCTPFGYYMSIGWPTLTSTGLKGVLDLTNDITKFTLHIAEDPRQSSATFTVRNAGQAQLQALRRRAGRHVVVKIGEMELFWGICKPPVFVEGQNDELSEYQFTAESVFSWMELPNCPDSPPFDNKPHTDFMKWLCTLEDFTDTDLEFPIDPGSNLGASTEPGADPIWQTKDCDSKSEWIRKICDLTGWILDDCPSAEGRMKLRYISKDDLSSTPVAEFYKSKEDNSDWTTWVRSLMETTEPPEATQVWVIGCTEDTEELIAAVYVDFKAEDATLEDADRPLNWMGRPIPVKIADASLRTMADLEKLAYNVAKTALRPRIRAEIDAEYRPGLWRYSPVTMAGETWRIVDMQIEAHLETEEMIIRPCRYTLELIQ